MRAMNASVGTLEPLVHVDDVEPYNAESDKALFNELHDVLERHGALKRFGVTLLHQHFDISDDEILLETTDRDVRTQMIQLVQKSEIGDLDYIETSWRLDTGQPMMSCICIKQGDSHSHQHRPSDAVLKQDVEPYGNALAGVLRLAPKTYSYNADAVRRLSLAGGQQIGFVAQEVEEVFPAFVRTNGTGDRSYKSLDYVGLIPALVGSIQEQQAMIEALRAELQEIKSKQ